ncbi:small multi-drug export protein [Candidatus Uhrbacteria bacterium]|nr:small multi-drug export protein [Candidatus Uhrbacteria bacterium]
MIETLIQWVSIFPPELASAVLAALPVTELQAALPVALFVFKLPPLTAYLSTVLGNLVPLFFLYLFLPRFMNWTLTHAPKIKQRLDRWFNALGKKHEEAYSKWGAFFLFLAVVIPLPGTGVWTATVLAIFFQIKRELAIPCIIVGQFIAGLIVLAFAQGVFQGLKLL